MKLKALGLALLLVLLGSVSAGTLAYFTADEAAHNVITSGGVDIDLVEKTINEDGELVPFPEEGVDGVMPGADVSKIVTVTNTGASEAWVRVKLTRKVTPEEGRTLTDEGALITYEIANPEKWTLKDDGYYYYSDRVAAGETTVPIIEWVKFAPAMGNEYQNCTAEVDVSAQAVQTANNGTSAAEAAGWPEE